MIRTDLIPFVLGAVFGATAVLLDAHGWLLHAFARILRAQWFTPAQRCPRCGREVHLLRHHPERAGAWGLADLGDRCVMCSGPEGSLRRPRSGQKHGPAGRLGILRGPGCPGMHGQFGDAYGYNHTERRRTMTTTSETRALPRYRKKPVVIEARQYQDGPGGGNRQELAQWCGGLRPQVSGPRWKPRSR